MTNTENKTLQSSDSAPDSYAETKAPSAEDVAPGSEPLSGGAGESKGDTSGQGESKSSSSTTTSKIEMPSGFSAEKFKQDKPGMDEIMRMMGYEAAPTPEQLEAQRKKKKREAIFAAIGDGITAIAGMFGGVNMYNPEKGQLAAHKSRWDKLEAEQKENRDKYFNTYMNIYGMKNTDAWKQYTQQHTEAREEKQDKRADEQLAIAKARQEREDAKAKLYNDYMQGRIDEQNYKTLIAGIDAGDRAALNKAKMYRLTHMGRGGGASKTYTAEEINADGTITTHTYGNQSEANKAQDKFDAAAGVAGTTNRTIETEIRSATGRTKGSSTSTRTGSTNKVERAADRQRIAAKRREAAQGGGNGDSSSGNGSWKTRRTPVGGQQQRSGGSGTSTGSKKLKF